MHANVSPGRSFRVDPFTFLVPGGPGHHGSNGSSPAEPMTLRRIAHEVVGIPIEELRAVNEDPLASMPADAVLEPGTKVRLPVVLDYQGSPYGMTLHLGSAEAQLQDCEALLDSLVSSWEGEYGSHSLECLPPRKVCSQTEAVLAKVHEEAIRQLPKVDAGLQRLGSRESKLPLLVEVGAIKAAERAIEESFQRAVAGLESFKKENEACGRVAPASLSSNDLTPASLHTKRDEGEDYCVLHTHRWEFAVHGVRSKEPREVWAVLSCQPLVALLDAIDCPATRDPLTTSRNAFFFIHGVFYIDDRHRAQADFVDLSEVIRGNDPLQDASSFHAPEHQGFSRCPVKSAAETAFKDLNIKMGESCLLRHCGGCDHYFFLSHARSLSGYPRKERHEFPHRVAKVRDQARRCLLCRLFPATIALYEDPLSPESPAFYCAVCFDLLHSGDTPEEAAQYQRREAKDFGEVYFKAT
ncbi:small nuclear RNA gene activation protein (SNAP) 50 [Leishmania donovani]|uniref:snRNA-activating protein of 50kDa MW C terminal family protein n=2 Tax=Leishmania donovani TaxID=5661 RepID=A0A504XP34_LEIDO|nr:snRNA-activating protein of 50kDa MW C terminal family protein [Leishmania donovani]TPP47870.1 snRNA-activating protein of 50kDa MW C terminal family protein [Leishmania donovani]CAJ1993284.1 small nuclear RNA gene activation protein (SNAP) 50 [Leishmania donovani]